MINNVECLGHSSIKMYLNYKIIYIDPYNISSKNNKDADLILITHSHYDHYSEKDILQIKKDNTKIIITADLMEKTIQLGFSEKNIISIVPNQILNVFDINIQTIPSYNTNKSFHPKENNWVGYVLDNKETRYYITGDTDLTPESEEVKCDVLFVPIGGTYTMDYKEASSLTNIINPKYVIPIHYGTIVGSKEDAIKFEKLISKDIKCEIMI